METQTAKIIKYTGKAWKHHVAEHFEDGSIPAYPNGAGKGGTIFIDYNKMVDYLKATGKRWYVAELDLKNDLLNFKYCVDYMAEILYDKDSDIGFVPLPL